MCHSIIECCKTQLPKLVEFSWLKHQNENNVMWRHTHVCIVQVFFNKLLIFLQFNHLQNHQFLKDICTVYIFYNN